MQLSREITTNTFTLKDPDRMKSQILMIALLALMAVPAAAQKRPKLASQMDSVSYIIGWDLGSRIKADSLGINPEIILAGLKEGMAGREVLTAEQRESVMSQFREAIQARQAASLAATERKNLDAGAKFLEANGKRPGVVTLPSGLQYEVIKEGTGAKPAATDKVTVHYTGTLIDGKVFDSSINRGPATFGVNEVIKGWTEALQLMPEGSKWKLYIPSDLAYGPQGRGEIIGANAVLVFEVELLKIGGSSSSSGGE
jgi:FKBP-type peptidyl-prolyl cis-trans isomerase FklB